MCTDTEFLKALDKRPAYDFLNWFLKFSLEIGKEELEKLSVFEVVQIYHDETETEE